MIPVISYCGFLGAPASHQANGAAICLDVRLLDATGQSLLVGHFSLRALVSACSLQPTMFTHCSLPFSFEGTLACSTPDLEPFDSPVPAPSLLHSRPTSRATVSLCPEPLGSASPRR
jgi:hypothetical protein